MNKVKRGRFLKFAGAAYGLGNNRGEQINRKNY